MDDARQTYNRFLSLQLLAIGATDALIRVHAGKSSRTVKNFRRLRSGNRLPARG